MEDPTTIALNLTFFGTLGLAFVMFLGLFLVFIATLVIAGVGRLAAVLVMAMFGRFPGEDTVDVVRLPGSLAAPSAGVPENEERQDSTRPASVTPISTPLGPHSLKRISGMLRTATGHLPLIGKTHRAPAEMAADWAEAVALADARAVARARAEKPAIDATLPDVPPPGVLPEEVPRVAPLVESALDQRPKDGSGPVPVPRSFKKPPTPGTEDLLDTGSLVSLAARPKSESVK
ncbi:hypothetical protein [Arthrobacter sp. R4-81]